MILGISIIIVLIIGLFAAAILLLLINEHISIGQPAKPWKRAGEEGEDIAREILRDVIKGGDAQLSNVEIEIDGKEAELDNVIINSRGVFIFEVKNYSGTLFGTEDDYRWRKVKISSGGNAYEKQVLNPIKQVKRQVYLLAQYLKYYGCEVWVEGYVYLLDHNSPVQSQYILGSAQEIDNVLHRGYNNQRNKKQVEQILTL